VATTPRPRPRAGPRGRCTPGDERGAGLLPSVFGLGVVLGLLGLCTNVALGLWWRSTTESVAYEAARMVATAPPDADPREVGETATDRACAALGPRCAGVTMTFAPTVAGTDGDMVELRVRAPGVRLLPRLVGSAGPVVGALDRTIRIRRELR
jgi:hypothetical protein